MAVAVTEAPAQEAPNVVELTDDTRKEIAALREGGMTLAVGSRSGWRRK